MRSFVLSDIAYRVLLAQKTQAEGVRIFKIETQSEYYKAWKRYCACNGINEISPYELRHTFVSVVKTLPAGEVKSVIGHSKNMDTFGIYSHALEGDDESTAQDINTIFQKLTATK